MSVVGIHGLKQRWVADTVRVGLTRPSAAWFTASARSWCAHAEATVCAAVYLALSGTTRQLLAEARGRNGYRWLFRRRPELLPALLLFSDRPAPTDVLHRYWWLGAVPAATEPYTKVERSQRTVAAAGGRFQVVELSLEQAAEAEERLADGARPDSWWQEHTLLRRVAMDARPQEAAVPLTRIGAFCAETARQLIGRIGPVPGFEGEKHP